MKQNCNCQTPHGGGTLDSEVSQRTSDGRGITQQSCIKVGVKVEIFEKSVNFFIENFDLEIIGPMAQVLSALLSQNNVQIS